MTKLWKTYRPVWQFLLVFFGTYISFSGLYFFALEYWIEQGLVVDPITSAAGRQVEWFLRRCRPQHHLCKFIRQTVIMAHAYGQRQNGSRSG